MPLPSFCGTRSLPSVTRDTKPFTPQAHAPTGVSTCLCPTPSSFLSSRLSASGPSHQTKPLAAPYHPHISHLGRMLLLHEADSQVYPGRGQSSLPTAVVPRPGALPRQSPFNFPHLPSHSTRGPGSYFLPLSAGYNRRPAVGVRGRGTALVDRGGSEPPARAAYLFIASICLSSCDGVMLGP